MTKSKQVAHKPHERWPKETREKVLRDYAVTGSVSVTNRTYPHIPRESINNWIRSDEGIALVTSLNQLKATEHRQAYSRLVDKSLAKAEAGIDKLDLDKLSAADIKSLVITGATSTDKVRLADNMPSVIKSDGGAQALQAAADLFHALANDKVLVPKSKVIDGSLDKGE